MVQIIILKEIALNWAIFFFFLACFITPIKIIVEKYDMGGYYKRKGISTLIVYGLCALLFGGYLIYLKIGKNRFIKSINSATENEDE